jgi:3-oxoadipate enol-lactonase
VREFLLPLGLATGMLACAAPMREVKQPAVAGRQALPIDDGGNGPAVPVVFVHGNGGASAQWQGQLLALRPHRRAIAYDLRGMGRAAPASDGDYSLKAAVGDLEALARTLRISRFVLVGHSYGGAIAATYAARHPNQIAGLVLVESATQLVIPEAAATQLAAALRGSREKLAPQLFGAALAPSRAEVRTEVFQSIARSDTSAFAETLLGLREFDARSVVPAFRGPRLAIVASAIEQAGSFQRQFPDYPVRRLEGAGHWLMLDQPAEFTRLLEEFLATVDQPPATAVAR